MKFTYPHKSKRLTKSQLSGSYSMSYSQFNTISSVKTAFNLTVVEGDRFLPELEAIAPSPTLSDYLQESLPIVATSGSEKARSEGIIYPVLLEVRRQLDRKVSLFSGAEFNVDESVGLNGVCDFLLTRSTQVLEIEAPAVMVVVEAKKTDIITGTGQCMAEMVAAQRFNEMQNSPIPKIYGSVSNGIQWQFMQLVESVVTIDLNVYLLPPVDRILGYLVWMTREN
uniref:hypothetical protein n=1 Tax=Okeania sp. SIO2F4 TaxID=2607790 RepID=UPI003449E469